MQIEKIIYIVSLLDLKRNRNGVVQGIFTLRSQFRELRTNQVVKTITPHSNPLRKTRLMCWLRFLIRPPRLEQEKTSQTRTTGFWGVLHDLRFLNHLSLDCFLLALQIRKVRDKSNAIWHAHDICSAATIRLMLPSSIKIIWTNHSWKSPAIEFQVAGFCAKNGFASILIGKLFKYLLLNPNISRIHLSNASLQNSSQTIFCKIESLIIPPAIQFHPPDPVGDKSEPIGKKKCPHILLVGNIEHRKRQYRLLELCQHLQQKGQSMRFYLIGDAQNSEARWIQNQLRKRHFSRHVHLIGTRPHAELSRWFSCMDCFLQLSDSESFGIALVEALMAGLPAAACKYPALAEIPTAGRLKIFKPESSARQIVQAIEEALEQGRLLGHVPNKLQRTYAPTRIARLHLNLYQKETGPPGLRQQIDAA